MTSPTARSARITRRTFAVTILGGAAVAAVGAWPMSWSLSMGGSGLDELTSLPQADALRHLGRRMLAATPLALADVETRLQPRLAAGGLEAAIANDRSTGATIAINGWQICESQALAGAWLALKSG